MRNAQIPCVGVGEDETVRISSPWPHIQPCLIFGAVRSSEHRKVAGKQTVGCVERKEHPWDENYPHHLISTPTSSHMESVFAGYQISLRESLSYQRKVLAKGYPLLHLRIYQAPTLTMRHLSLPCQYSPHAALILQSVYLPQKPNTARASPSPFPPAPSTFG